MPRADHQTPLSRTPAYSSDSEFAPGALASWQDADGARWILAPTAGPVTGNAGFTVTNGAVTNGAVVAWKVVDQNGAPALQPGWVSRDLISLRMEKLRQHYPWLSGGLDYFEARLTQAPEDAKFAIEYVHEHATTRAEQELAIQAPRDKCDILWAQLDALYFAYVEPGWPPPGAFRISKEDA